MKWRLLIVLMLSISMPMQSAMAESDHDRARGAVQRGEIRPLAELIPIIEADLRGQLMEIELERRGATWVYEAEVLTADGVRMERDYDAATGAALGLPQADEDDEDEGDED
jgi:uncharacterized membrane protein YkoI